MNQHAAARTLVTLVSASMVVAACTSAHHVAAPPSTTAAAATSTAPPTTSPAPTSTVSATTTTPPPPGAQRLLSALRTDRFGGSGLPAHLHVVGVGPWQYADAGHVGKGNIGSARVSLRSDSPGEEVSGIYDVFTTAAAAKLDFDRAYSNFRTSSPLIPGRVSLLHLHPPVEAFCGPQYPANSTTCWFVHGATTGIVGATIPSAADRGDDEAVVQAMLTHLLALGG